MSKSVAHHRLQTPDNPSLPGADPPEGYLVEVNPYDSPESGDEAEISSGVVDEGLDSRKNLEGAVAVVVAMSLAGSWAGVSYQGESSLLALSVVTIAVLVGAIVYASVARRLRPILLLPVLVLAIVGRELVAGFFLFYGLVGLPIAVAVSAARPTPQNWMLVGRMVLVILTAVASLFLYAGLKELGARRAADRGQDVIDAIERYQRREGRLPSSLGELVPKDLPLIPDTGMGRFPSFEYIGPESKGANEAQYPFDSYELRVNLYRFLQFDRLVYWPEGNYPDAMYGGGVERIGDWAYVHE